MRLVIIGLMMLFVISCQEAPRNTVTMQEDVAVLAADEMGGRQTGTPGELLAAAYITERFSDIGLTPKGSEGNFTQTFSFTPSANTHEQSEFTNSQEDGSVTGTNVIGYINNNAANLDVQNGGFTVFGQVLGNGMEIVDAITSTPNFNFGGTFTSIPLRNYTSADQTAGTAPTDSNLVLMTDIVVVNAEVITNSNLNPARNTLLDTGTNNEGNADNSSSSGGSIGTLLISLMAVFALRRRVLKV